MKSKNAIHTDQPNNLEADADNFYEEEMPKIRRSKAMTMEKLIDKVQAGYGQGHGNEYQPWLQIRRKNTSPTSNQVVAWMPPLERTAHYWSRGEFYTALLLLWLGVQDLREQFPLWPNTHPHPLVGALGSEDMEFKWSSGLLKIAADAGIDHGVEFGTNIPYVATIDLLATVHQKNGLKLIGFSSKPFGDSDIEIKNRTLERLELERRYFEEIEGAYFVTSSALVPSLVAGQLEWWIDCATLHFASELLPLADSFANFLNCFPELSMAEAVEGAANSLAIRLDEGWLLFRHCAWTQKIDINPSVQVLTSYPVKSGGVALRAELRKKYFGEN